MSRYFLIISFIILPFLLFSQKKDKSDYVSKSQKAPQLENVERIYKTDPRSAIIQLERIISQANKKNDKPTLGRAYTLLGDINYEQTLYSQALKNYQYALNIQKPLSDPLKHSKLHYKTGYVYYRLQQWPTALKAFEEALKIAPDKTQKMVCIQAIASVYSASGDWEKAEALYDILIREYGEKGDFKNQAISQAELSRVYARKKEMQKANITLLQSMSNASQNVLPDTALFYEQLDEAAQEVIQTNRSINQEDDAIKIIEENIRTKEQLNAAPEKKIKDKLEIADIYLKQRRLDEAENLIAELELSNDKFPVKERASLLEKSSRLSETRGDYAEAFIRYKDFVKTQEQVFQEKEKLLNQRQEILSGQQRIDLAEKDVKIEQKDADLLLEQLKNQRILSGFLLTLLAIAAFSGILILRNIRAKRKANRLLLLRSLRTQMNPHFIFNALNSLNVFISQNDERAANRFVSDFSQLMRTVLEHSKKDLIPLSQEMAMLKLYLKLEHYRFRDKFEYQLDISPEIGMEDTLIPPMLVQPYIENAIWHGLRYKTDKGSLKLQFAKKEDHIQISVQDDGIGRERSISMKTDDQEKRASTGLKNTATRIELIRKIYGRNYQVNIRDCYPEKEDKGTLVTIIIPSIKE
ncbi:MAG: tetratricopeptide repeat protein [Bacteroidetes bacterium]|nr:tetratricopeptide repeat protein [Bacteroidota bacterium]